MQNNTVFKLRLLAMLGVAVFFLGCKDESGILGLDVQPGGDQPLVGTIDTLSLIAYTVDEDSLRTDETVLNLIGALNDPVFGNRVAGFYSQWAPEVVNIDFGTNPILDSVVLTLQYHSIYGDSNATQTLAVYEMTDSIAKDSRYYSNLYRSYNPSPLAQKTLALRASDSIVVDELTLAPHIRIPLDSAFGQNFLNADPSNLGSEEALLDFFKGLFITSLDSNLSSGEGAIASYDLLKSATGLHLYYTNDEHTSDSTNLQFTLYNTNQLARVGVFSEDYSNSTEISTALNDSTTGQQQVYLQGLSGLKVQVEIPYFEQLKDSNLVINRAWLQFPIADGSQDEYAVPSKGLLAQKDTSGTLFITDQFEGETHFGGQLVDDAYYQFNITRHLNEVLRGETPNNPLVLVPSASVINPQRCIINGPEASANPMRLFITFTQP